MIDDLSPLSNFLGGEPSLQKKKSARTQKLLIAVVAAVGISSMNTTLAGSITLGSQDIEFGQGLNSASACDNSINVAVNTAWSNADNYFKVSDLTLTGLNTVACLGKTLTIRAWNGTTELNLNAAGSPSNAISYTVPSNVGTNATVPLSVAGNIDSANVTKVLIETN